MIAPCYQCEMVFDHPDERNQHVLQHHTHQVRSSVEHGKAVFQLAKYASPSETRRFNKLPRYGEQPTEPFVCG